MWLLVAKFQCNVVWWLALFNQPTSSSKPPTSWVLSVWSLTSLGLHGFCLGALASHNPKIFEALSWKDPRKLQLKCHGAEALGELYTQNSEPQESNSIKWRDREGPQRVCRPVALGLHQDLHHHHHCLRHSCHYGWSRPQSSLYPQRPTTESLNIYWPFALTPIIMNALECFGYMQHCILLPTQVWPTSVCT